MYLERITKTRVAERLFNILEREGHWMTRGDIADELGRSKLTSYQIMVLEALVEIGELEKKDDSETMKPAFYYKVKEVFVNEYD